VKIYCCGCNKKVKPVLVNGKVVYPHRTDLNNLQFYMCEKCKNFVGCHRNKYQNKTKQPIPLGVIPTKEIKIVRRQIHSLIDPLWKNGRISRSKLYAVLSKKLGYNYHTANIRSVEEANVVVRLLGSKEFYK